MAGKALIRLVLVGLWLGALAVPAAAQMQLGGIGIEGNVEAGWRFFVDEPPKSRRAKWEEYNDYPGSAFLGELRLRFFTPDEKYSLDLEGTKWGQEDQYFAATATRLGLWQFGFSWDQTPHLLSTTAQLLAAQPSPGVFILPAPRPSLFDYNAAPTLDKVAVRWDTAKVFFNYSPFPDLDIKAEYNRIHKSGERPFGMAFGSPGNNFYQVLQPIDQTIHDFRLQGTWAKEQWQLQFGYVLSVFDNDLDRVRADNPCFGLTAVVAAGGCAGDATGAPATGQSSLPPTNIANTFTLSGGVNLPMRTRLTANVAYSFLLQNQDFLPFTINPALASNPNLALPQSDLNGFVQTVLVNLGAVTRPLQPLTITAKYRFFDLDDDSDTITFPASVLDDRTLTGVRTAPRFSYQRQNASVDGRWQFKVPVAVTLGGGWERWTRNDAREVPTSDEGFGKLAVDTTPYDWLMARITYRPSVRRISRYETRNFSQLTVIEDEGTRSQGQSVLLRKFDEANRNVQEVDVYAQITPTDPVTITPSGSYKWIQYPLDDPVDPAGTRGHFLGVQNQTAWNAGIDVTWTPSERIALSAGYMYESSYQKMESRSRPVSGGVALDFTSFDWISNINDTNNTAYVSLKTSLIPGMLDWNVNASYAYALGTVDTRNPVAPFEGTASQNDTATAKRMPAFDNQLIRVETALAYHFLKVWTARLGYVFETYSKHDWRTDTLNPFMPVAGSSIWLGNNIRNYTAHIIAASVGYQFK
jgi:MtrB/PioB family decaheme-associated outer membrane protein